MQTESLRVLITGASSGIGAACAKRFSKGGHPLVLIARRYERLLEIKAELSSPVDIFKLDVSSREAVSKTLGNLGPIDVLINNAGSAQGLNPAQTAALDDWDQMIDANIKGVVYCTHALLPGMVARKKGHIINLGSVAGNYPYPGGNVYGATKAFVRQFSLNLRADLLGTAVRVTCIEPGLTGDTEFSAVRFKGDEERVKNLYAHAHPLTPEDIAEAIFWCAHQPQHVNINLIELMPTSQAFASLAVHKS